MDILSYILASGTGGGGGGSTVTILDNPSGGIDLIVDGTLKTIAKESDLAGKQKEINSTTIQLSLDSWTNHLQTVQITGILTTDRVIIAPVTRADMVIWGNSEILCLENTVAGQLTFECITDPTEDITVNVVWG